MSENRCLRCNRKLSDPNARYGWRCAEIMQKEGLLNYAGDNSFDAFMDGIRLADEFLLKHGIDPGKIDLSAFYQASIKCLLAEGMGNEELVEQALAEAEQALSPQRDAQGNPISTPRLPLEEYIRLRDNFDYQNGSFTTDRYLGDTPSAQILAAQELLNSLGAVNRFGDSLKADGLFGPNTQWALDGIINTGAGAMHKATAKMNARIGLNRVVDRQYRNFAPPNLFSKIADARLKNAIQKVEYHKELINSVGNFYGIPPEVIGSIIIKEQYTQSLPDPVVISLRKFNIRGTGSVGLGAIQAKTAKEALNYIGHPYDLYGMKVPQNPTDLLIKLDQSETFNIHVIAAVLAKEAFDLGLADLNSLHKLTDSEWKKVIAKYNGTGMKAKEYGEKVYEYLPYVKVLLS